MPASRNIGSPTAAASSCTPWQLFQPFPTGFCPLVSPAARPRPSNADSGRHQARQEYAWTLVLLLMPAALTLLRYRLADNEVFIALPYLALSLLIAAGYLILMLKETNRRRDPASQAEAHRLRELSALAAAATVFIAILTAFPTVNWPLSLLAGVMAGNSLILYRNGRPRPAAAPEPAA